MGDVDVRFTVVSADGPIETRGCCVQCGGEFPDHVRKGCKGEHTRRGDDAAEGAGAGDAAMMQARDAKRIAQVIEGTERQCGDCGAQLAGDLDAQVAHFKGHGYELVWEGLETRRGKHLMTAVLGLPRAAGATP